MQVRKQQLELDMEQQTHFKQEKEYIKAIYCHSAYLHCVQSTSHIMGNAGLDESQAVIKTVRGYADDTTNGREQRGTKEPLDEGEKDQ